MPNQDPAVRGMLCVLLIPLIVVVIFYFVTLQKALLRVAPHNRMLEPGKVWLGLIPLFNLIWNFVLALRIPESLRNEFGERGEDDGSDYGRGIGVGNAILALAGVFLNLANNGSPDPLLFLIIVAEGLVSLVLFIIFWVRIAGYSRRLATPGPFPYQPLDDGDEDDHSDRGPPAPSSEAIRSDNRWRYRRRE
jgi:hypothetical protein